MLIDASPAIRSRILHELANLAKTDYRYLNAPETRAAAAKDRRRAGIHRITSASRAACTVGSPSSYYGVSPRRNRATNSGVAPLRIHAGYTIAFDCPQPTPMLLQLGIHPSRTHDLLTSNAIQFDPPVAVTSYHDAFDNCCTRLVAPAGRLEISSAFDIQDSGEPDKATPDAVEHRVEDLPDEVLVYLLGSRYCDTDRLSDIAWSLFANTPTGWRRVQAICDFVHDRITFNYLDASVTRTAFEGYTDRIGVCRDYAHLAVALCRCMNIPARYCTGYLGDMGMPPPYAAGDFSAWFEAYLGGAWHIFDARFNIPRIGRVLIARGRDATDCAISTSFGTATLAGFTVITDEVLG